MSAENVGRSEWDVVVVGGAPPGENVAQYATQFSGLDAVIVEEALVGGECSYWACMPSKALLRPVELFAEAAALPGLREVVAGRSLDRDAVLRRRDEVIKNLDDASQVAWARSVGVDIVRGRGRLDGVRRVAVTGAGGGTRVLTARHAVVLDTGSAARIPEVDGFAAARPWTSRDVTNMHEIPGRIVVVGGGVVAGEAATWLRGLGCQVTVVAPSDRLLRRLEPFAGQLVADGLRAAGVDVVLGERVVGVSRPAVNQAGYGLVHGGEVTVTLSGGHTVVADELVAATGRVPNSTDIGLETVGLESGGFIEVDDQFGVVGVEGGWLYAVGDVIGRALLTHMGKYQARIAGEVIAARAAGRPLAGGAFSIHTDVADHGRVPQVTFTSPEVGSVGRTEEEARAAGMPVETVEYDLAALAGTYLLRDGYTGRAKLVLDGARDVLVGATFVGQGVAELTHSATVAVVGEVPLDRLWHAVPSYPTISEVWLRLLETLDHQRRGG
jgi:pyruvate/2-oxoglutarate dehydrogenase complex dihydrolipoamide dehydrogenase (E3) component